MSEKKKLIVRVCLGLAGSLYIVGGLMIPLRHAARTYYHWLGADWHTGADMGGFMLSFSVFIAAVCAIGAALFPPKALEPKS